MWWVYVIETKAGRFYTGVTTDINKRFRQHLGVVKGGAKFFRSDPPAMLIYLKNFRTQRRALQSEYLMKQLSRKQKERLIYVV